LVKLSGVGAISEFAGAVEAVAAAIDFQQESLPRRHLADETHFAAAFPVSYSAGVPRLRHIDRGSYHARSKTADLI
jgi:hypothetical protein